VRQRADAGGARGRGGDRLRPAAEARISGRAADRGGLFERRDVLHPVEARARRGRVRGVRQHDLLRAGGAVRGRRRGAGDCGGAPRAEGRRAVTPERWRRVEELFHGALERDRGKRDRFLADACGGDASLASEVRDLLQQAEREDALVTADESPAAASKRRFAAGDRVGPYEILAPIGAGGMGEVYRARHTQADQIVALKVVKEG